MPPVPIRSLDWTQVDLRPFWTVKLNAPDGRQAFAWQGHANDADKAATAAMADALTVWRICTRLSEREAPPPDWLSEKGRFARESDGHVPTYRTRTWISQPVTDLLQAAGADQPCTSSGIRIAAERAAMAAMHVAATRNPVADSGVRLHFGGVAPGDPINFAVILRENKFSRMDGVFLPKALRNALYAMAVVDWRCARMARLPDHEWRPDVGGHVSATLRAAEAIALAAEADANLATACGFLESIGEAKAAAAFRRSYGR